nr:MAG TPA: hypothetical protein [Caudoviricetes sp.]
MAHTKDNIPIVLVAPFGSQLRFCLFFITTSTFIFSVHC